MVAVNENGNSGASGRLLRRYRLNSADPDQARRALLRILAPVTFSLTAATSAQFALSVDAVCSGPVMTASGSVSVPLTSTWSGGNGYRIVMSEAGQALVRHGHDESWIDSARGVLLRPGEAVTFRHDAEFRPFLVAVEARAFRPVVDTR